MNGFWAMLSLPHYARFITLVACRNPRLERQLIGGHGVELLDHQRGVVEKERMTCTR